MTTSIVARGLDQCVELLRAVSPDDLQRPTPCSEWTVADLSDHIVNSTAGMATMAHGGAPDWANAAHHDDPATVLEAEGRALVDALAGSDSFPTGMAAAELAVHAYDLATALGRDTAGLDPEVAETGLEFMSASMKPEMRGDAFGPEQPAPEGADVYRRLAAFAGRTV
ncbi:maleylpyruvate isomerase family mycothiol-dependent enzyme [Nocardioides sp.]|uniref:maleylpyruvate isomerase family mycothiol-dependent enzyme n=1 Tax=Nocardioides sp. TaxID=35761 RepID=UPI001A236C75|nr:maleylpyruvate isomerase family mycothiol-dependent enzyme [Nocardioides sp.]MBJ7357975.1 maleylpyruvate isomerase family mycothiol-dependent enzyme [Nocardioides sp.]